MNWKILYSVLFLILASATYVWASGDDDVIIQTEISKVLYRNYTVNALTQNQRFEVNVTEEGLNTTDYLCAVQPIVSNQNEIDLSFIPPKRDYERREICFWFISNNAAVSRNVTLELIILGTKR